MTDKTASKAKMVTDVNGVAFWLIPKGEKAVGLCSDRLEYAIGTVTDVTWDGVNTWGCTMALANGQEFFPKNRTSIRPPTKLEQALL